MTIHQRTHPEFVPGCYGCKIASVSTYGCYPTRGQGVDATKQKRWDAECDAYRDAVKNGIEPDGTTKPKVEFAKAMSDHAGVGYGTPEFKKKLATDALERGTL